MFFPFRFKRLNRQKRPAPRRRKVEGIRSRKGKPDTSYYYEHAQELTPALDTPIRPGAVLWLERALQDTVTTGAAAGIIGTLAMHLLSTGWQSLGLIGTTTMEVSGEIFLNPVQLRTAFGIIVSIIAHFTVGAAGGVLLAYVIKLSGKDFYWLKGLGLAGFMLLAGMGMVVDIMRLAPQMRSDSLMVLLHMVSYFVYGLLTSYIIYRYGRFNDAVL